VKRPAEIELRVLAEQDAGGIEQKQIGAREPTRAKIGRRQRRVKIFAVPDAALKLAVAPVPTSNWVKLWKRLLPIAVPALMPKVVPDCATLLGVGSVASGVIVVMTWAQLAAE
jgi:hypothetical protein